MKRQIVSLGANSKPCKTTKTSAFDDVGDDCTEVWARTLRKHPNCIPKQLLDLLLDHPGALHQLTNVIVNKPIDGQLTAIDKFVDCVVTKRVINDASIVTLVCNSINAKDTEVVKCRISELPRWFGLLIREFLDDQAELQHSNLGDLRLKFTNNELCGSGGLKFTIEEPALIVDILWSPLCEKTSWMQSNSDVLYELFEALEISWTDVYGDDIFGKEHEVYQDEGDKKILCVDKIEEDYNLVASILTEAITAKSDALGEFLSELRQDVSVKNSKIVASRSSVATFYLDMNNFVEGF